MTKFYRIRYLHDLPNTICRTSEHDLSNFRIRFTELPNTICRTSEHDISNFRIRFTELPNTICRTSEQDLPNFRTRFIELSNTITEFPNTICRTSKPTIHRGRKYREDLPIYQLPNTICQTSKPTIDEENIANFVNSKTIYQLILFKIQILLQKGMVNNRIGYDQFEDTCE